MDQETEVLEPETEELPPNLSANQHAILNLASQGFKTGEIAKRLHITDVHVSNTKRKFKKYLLTHPARVKKLSQACDGMIDRALSNPESKVSPLVWSMRLEAEKRINPEVKQSMNMNINADISVVDLSRYRDE